MSNEKTKNSISNKRGSIVKSIDKLASSIASDEANSAVTITSSVIIPMIMVMQQQQLQQLQQQMQFQKALLQRGVVMQIKGAEVQVKSLSEVMMKVLRGMKRKEQKEKKKKMKKKAKNKKAVAEAGGDKVDLDSSSSSSSSSSFY